MSPKIWLAWLLLGLAGLVIGLIPLSIPSWSPIERTFRVEASQFAYNPAVLVVNPGDKVTLELVSTDVVHGLYVDGYDLSVEANPGQTARLTFTVDKPGSFRFRCNVTCGALHPFMIGKLQVGQNTPLWRAAGLVILAAIAGIIRVPRLLKVKAS
jgi:heme/copper-type cytochrome/quinol oxidase subunit 2